jgi:hypothetical protein
LSISSDYSDSNHKGKLWVNEKRIGETFEDFWKKIKTKKRLRMSAYFSEIDWYDDMTDMYETPTFSIGRGLKRAKISSRSHGSIPKDWSFNLTVTFDDMDRLSPVVDVIHLALGNHLTDKDKVEITKEFKKFPKQNRVDVYIGVDDDDED